MRANPDFSLASEEFSPNLLIHTSAERLPYRDGPLVMHLSRMLSAALSTVAVWAVYGLAQLVSPGSPGIALGTAGFVAFVPVFLFINGAVNNDSLVAALSAATAGVRASDKERPAPPARHCPGLAAGPGIALESGNAGSRPVAALALSLCVAASLSHASDRPGMPRPGVWSRFALRSLGWLALTFGAAGAVAAPWMLRNYRLYGDPLGWDLVRATVDLRQLPLGWADLAWLVKGLFTTFWGRFGGAVRIRLPTAVYGLLGGLTALSAAGLVVGPFE